MVRRSLLQILLLVLVWWILAGSLRDSWLAGSVAVGVGLALYLRLGGGRGQGVRFFGLFTFVPYFAWQSIRGGWDVSRRALTPGMPLDPTLLLHELSLPPGPSRVFLTNALSLLPGTFGADLRDDRLVVHLLVGGSRNEARVRELEARVARLFGVPGS